MLVLSIDGLSKLQFEFVNENIPPEQDHSSVYPMLLYWLLVYLLPFEEKIGYGNSIFDLVKPDYAAIKFLSNAIINNIILRDVFN